MPQVSHPGVSDGHIVKMQHAQIWEMFQTLASPWNFKPLGARKLDRQPLWK